MGTGHAASSADAHLGHRDRQPLAVDLQPLSVLPRRAGSLAAYARKPLVSKPGEKFQYSNGGYMLLAQVVAKASGMDFQRFLEENIFAPLGMTHSGCDRDRLDARSGTRPRPVRGQPRVRSSQRTASSVPATSIPRWTIS